MPFRLVRAHRALTKARWFYEHAKAILFVYVVVTHSLKGQRHLRARGICATLRDTYKWLCQRLITLFLRLPAVERKVEYEMSKARLDIESKLVPQGAGVVRHLSLPPQGKSPEWISAEMDKMDTELTKESGTLVDWKEGKISGAIYRMSPSRNFMNPQHH
jgi:sphinganine-1-phosphate aldolase